MSGQLLDSVVPSERGSGLRRCSRWCVSGCIRRTFNPALGFLPGKKGVTKSSSLFLHKAPSQMGEGRGMLHNVLVAKVSKADSRDNVMVNQKAEMSSAGRPGVEDDWMKLINLFA